MVKLMTRAEAEYEAGEMSKDGRVRMVSPGFDAAPSWVGGRNWLVLTVGEYGRLNVLPAVSAFKGGDPVSEVRTAEGRTWVEPGERAAEPEATRE